MCIVRQDIHVSSLHMVCHTQSLSRTIFLVTSHTLHALSPAPTSWSSVSGKRWKIVSRSSFAYKLQTHVRYHAYNISHVEFDMAETIMNCSRIKHLVRVVCRSPSVRNWPNSGSHAILCREVKVVDVPTSSTMRDIVQIEFWL
jgi:hypothetical protein